MSTLPFGKSVPPSPIPIRNFRMSDGVRVYARILSHEMVGFLTHYHKGRSRVCLYGDCPPDRHKMDRQWKGYLAVQIFAEKEQSWLPTAFEVSQHLELDLRDVWRRGQIWKFSKETSERKNAGPVTGVFIGDDASVVLPDTFDLWPMIRAVYQCEVMPKICANPMPARVAALASPAEGFDPRTIDPKAIEEDAAYAQAEKRRQQAADEARRKDEAARTAKPSSFADELAKKLKA